MHLLSSLHFQKSIGTQKTDLYTLRNSHGMTAQISNYGATLVSLWVKDKTGTYRDVVLGYENLDDYLEMTNPYFGRTIGPYGNRIANGHFEISGKDYYLEKNNGRHNLHSGSKSYNTVVWEKENHTSNTLKLSYYSKDGENGFPGNSTVMIIYKVTEQNTLDIHYQVTTDTDTHVNMTHHSYFNLDSCGKNTVHDHILQIKAKAYLPVTKECIPLHQSERVDGTPFDFNDPKKIGSAIDTDHPQIELAQGYDHNFVLEGNGYREVAEVINQSSGIAMKVLTNEPGLQFYSGNDIVSLPVGKYNTVYLKRSGFCLESQHYPDSPNRSDFPSTLLKKGELYVSRCTYAFEIIKQ